jgi:hypothetical protein
MKKIFKKIWPELKVFPWAMLFAVPFMFFFVWWVDNYENGVYIVGYILSIVGFYIIRLSSSLLSKRIKKIEEALNKQKL